MGLNLTYPRKFRSDVSICLVIGAFTLLTFAFNRLIKSALVFQIHQPLYDHLTLLVAAAVVLTIGALSIRRGRPFAHGSSAAMSFPWSSWRQAPSMCSA